ncbi:MAG TPA: TonB-dependent receptor [Gammaproteobacteria bacterium]|nr:TonB-dependent receptor [Gammaproteobacteria bacterium]
MNTRRTRTSRPAYGLLASAISTLLAGMAVTVTAHAQAGGGAAAEGGVEEITVTGSRIVRRDFEANSPITTVDSTRFDESSNVGMESVLNQLPQFVPAVSQFNVGSEFGVQGTSFFSEQLSAGASRTPGQATLSLRGLGPNRNLVLLDGRRAMPINASMAVSINTIPSAAIERVETITGGASSVYGADAVAGVVNFITKQNFEGIDFDVQAGQTAEGDGREYRFSAVIGANSPDGRGNVLLGFERSKRDEIFAVDRDFRMEGYTDPRSLSATDFYSAAGYSPDPNNMHSAAAVAQIFAGAPGPVRSTGSFYMNSDGTLYKETSDGAYRYNGSFFDAEGLPWRYIEDSNASSDGQLRQNEVHEYLQIPLDRYSLFGRGHIDVNDNLRVFAQVLYSESDTEQRQAASPMLGGWRASAPHGNGVYAPSVDANGNTLPEYLPGGRFGLACPPVGGCTKSQAFPTPPELTALLDSRLNPEADWEFRQTTVFADPRRSYVNVNSYQLIGGFDGKIPIKDWTWELYASSGSTFTESTYGGALSLERWRFVMRQPNYGRGMLYIGNELGAGFASGAITCTSGLPAVYGVSGYFEGFVPSEDCQEAIGAKAKASSRMRQNVIEYNMQGGLADMKAGNLRFALGAGTRENRFEFNPDTLNSQASVLDQLAGFFPVGEAEGKTEVKELYGELLVPVVANVWGAKDLNLELGYRVTDNDPSNDVDTWKALIDWQVVDRVRVRGGKQIANRAPNIGELFQSQEQFAPFTLVQGDPCSELNPAALPYTANPNVNPAGPAVAAQVKGLCEQLMGPTGAANYYGGDTPQPSGFVSPRISNLSGNPNLRSEEAETLTLGVVANLTERALLTLDYWRIQVDDMIAPQVPDTLYRDCLSFDTNPTFDPAHPSCQLIVRNPSNGAVATVDVIYTNEASADLAGYDLQFDWRKDLGPGTLSLSELATITDRWMTRVNKDSPWVDYKGTTGPSDIRGVNQFAYDYRLFTTLGYSTGSWSADLRWRHFPSIVPEGAIRTTAQYHTTPSYDIFDASGRYTFTNKLELRFGVDNLLDVDPPIVNLRTVAEGYTQTGVTNASFYDVLGRRYYMGLRYQF